MIERHLPQFTTAARRELRSIPAAEAMRILRKLTELQRGLDADDVTGLDIKAMVSKPGNYRLRVGRYRAVYRLVPDENGQLIVWIVVITVGHRRDVYRSSLAERTAAPDRLQPRSGAIGAGVPFSPPPGRGTPRPPGGVFDASA